MPKLHKDASYHVSWPPIMVGQDHVCMQVACAWFHIARPQCTNQASRDNEAPVNKLSLSSKCEQVASGLPTTCIGLDRNRRLLTWLYTWPDLLLHSLIRPKKIVCPPTLPWVLSWPIFLWFSFYFFLPAKHFGTSMVALGFWVIFESCLNLVVHKVFGFTVCHLGQFVDPG